MNNIVGIYQDIAVILGELMLLVLLLVLVTWMISLIFNRIESIPFLRRFHNEAKIIERNIKGLLLLISFVFALAIVGFNGYLIYQETNVLTYSLQQIPNLASGFWTQLGLAVVQIIGLLIAAIYGTRMIHYLLMRLQERAKAFKQLKANNESIEHFFTTLNHIQQNGIRLLVLALIMRLLPLSPVVSDSLFLLLTVYLIIALARLLVTAVAAIVDSLDELSQKYTSSANLQEFYDHLRDLIPLFKSSLEYIIYVSAATLVMIQVEFIAPFATYGPIIIQIIGIVFLSRVIVKVVGLLVDKMLLKRGDLTDVQWKQRLTMAPLFKSMLTYGVYFTAFLFILRAFDINTAPILAAIGGIGLIIGLGAQSVINDLVSGAFILFENLYLVGDYIETSDARGYVEAIEIRTTHIRDPNGQLHILRNGEIGEIVNYSKEYTFAVVEVGVGYGSDLNQVYRLLQEIGETLKETNSNVLNATDVRGLESFGESELVIRTLTKVKPGTHRTVARDLRKRIKDVFDREGIEIPFPQRVLTFNNQPNT